VASIHLSSIGYVHGERRPVAELDLAGTSLGPLVLEIEHYRASDLDIWQLASAAAERALATAPAAPELLIYVSENDPDRIVSVARVMTQVGLPAVDYLAVSGHDCGNLGPALRVATDALHSGACRRVLLILADRALSGRRIMASGMSVFSDGAAACVLTRDAEEDASGPQFVMDGLATTSQVRLDADPDQMILATVRLAKASVARILADTAGERAQYDHVLFGNYRPASQLFLANAMGFPPDKLLLGPVTEFGHCFSADLLVTLHRYRVDGTLRPGSRVLAATTGLYSWSTVALRCR
jgi:3-oxoacyl-[acyl-carrier-protein] synthase III